MEKKGFMGRLKVLSKPTGKPQWKLAVKSMIIMVLAGFLAEFLGLNQGVGVIVSISLLATIIIDLPLPLRKIVVMAVIGFFMTFLAFICSSLALTSMPAFLFFTVIWAFFSLSMYIFGETVGILGFMIFTSYFISVIMVNQRATTIDWGLYVIVAYLVSSLLFIPKIYSRKKDVLKMVSAPFVPKTSLETVLSIRNNLSGVPLDKSDYELFKIGNYLAGFRAYSELLLSRLNDNSQELFQKFINSTNEASVKIASSINRDSSPVSLKSVNNDMKNLEEYHNSPVSKVNTLVEVAHEIKLLLNKANEELSSKKSKPPIEKLKISSSRNSLNDVLRANFNLKNMYMRHAIRFTLALTLGLLAVYLSHERDAIWITMGILIIIKPDVTSTLNNIIVRVSFNLMAILMAIVMGFLFPHEILLAVAFLMLFFFRAFYPTYMGLSVMALTVFVVLIWPNGPVWENALARIIDISLGAVIAFICAYLILPSRVTVNLPEQIVQTIRTNLKYAEEVIPSEKTSYNHDRAVGIFRDYMLEEKNLESAIKKVDDTFNDVEDDLSIYNEFYAANMKLAGDLSAIATLIESHGSLQDISRFKEQLTNALSETILAIDKNVILPKSTIDKLPNILKEDEPKNNELTGKLYDYFNWIISDVEYLQELTETGVRSGSLNRYRNMT